MKTRFTFYKNRNQVTENISAGKFNSRIFAGIIGLTMMFGFSGNSHAQTTLVVPNSNETSSFTGPIASTSRKLQFIIDESLLTSLVGKNLTAISFRLPSSVTADWPTAPASFSTYDILLSNSVKPADRQLDFGANVVGIQTQVRGGGLTIPTNALTSGSNPNNFSFKIKFESTWQYNGGNLLIEVRHSGTTSSRSVAATLTSSPGYGTLYSAIFQSTSAPTAANFSYIEITADGLLGSNSVKIGENPVIYPNPTVGLLHVKSDKEFTSYSAYNMAGQLISTEKISGKTPLNVERFPAGQYLLKLTDKNGNVESTTFIKK